MQWGTWGVPGRGGARSKGGYAPSGCRHIFLVLESLHSVHVFIRLQKDALRLYAVGLRRVQLMLENQGHLRVQQRVGIGEVWMRRQESDSACVAHKWHDGSAAHRAPASTSLRLHRAPWSLPYEPSRTEPRRRRGASRPASRSAHRVAPAGLPGGGVNHVTYAGTLERQTRLSRFTR